jgi:hypothetical protein
MKDYKETNPKDEAAAGIRVDLSLVPQTGIIYAALGFTEGHLKYGGYNWRVSGVKASVYAAAFLRHFIKWFNGEWVDPKTQVPHLASCIACLMIVIDGYEMGNLIDDRPPALAHEVSGGIGELLSYAEDITKHLHEKFPPSQGPGRYTEEGIREKKINDFTDGTDRSISSWGLFPNSGGD